MAEVTGEVRTVYIKNIDPCWVEYRFEVDIPADTPADEIEAVAMREIEEGKVHPVWGPEVMGTIDGMDNEYTILGD